MIKWGALWTRSEHLKWLNICHTICKSFRLKWFNGFASPNSLSKKKFRFFINIHSIYTRHFRLLEPWARLWRDDWKVREFTESRQPDQVEPSPGRTLTWLFAVPTLALSLKRYKLTKKDWIILLLSARWTA